LHNHFSAGSDESTSQNRVMAYITGRYHSFRNIWSFPS